jgi:hypothetical protein
VRPGTAGSRIADARPVICEDIDELLASHKLLRGPALCAASIERDHCVIESTGTAREAALIVKLAGPIADPAWRVDDLSLEEIVVAYLGQGSAASPRLAGALR